jgi:predicted nucleic acid-binding protein
VAPGPRIVLDANILIRAVLGARVKHIITDHALHAEFFAPEAAYEDATHYLPEILAKHGRGDEIEHALAFVDRLRAVVLPVPEEAFEHRRADALSQIESRDPDDWPVLAAALAIECPIWTEDQDFFGVGVPIWTTDRVELYFDASGAGD